MIQPGAFPLALQRLSQHIDSMPALFMTLDKHAILQKPAPGKWSKQEIIGHLIDSAINNLKRFTDAQCMPQPYMVNRYRQDDLVQINNYQYLPTEHILYLWTGLNRQIAEVLKNVPQEKLEYIVLTYDSGEKTLEWLMIDYVDHLEHHLKQVFG